MLLRKTEEISISLFISDPTVTLIQALKMRAFHLLCISLSSESDTCYELLLWSAGDGSPRRPGFVFLSEEESSSRKLGRGFVCVRVGGKMLSGQSKVVLVGNELAGPSAGLRAFFLELSS